MSPNVQEPSTQHQQQNLQNFTANTITFRDDETKMVMACDIVETLASRDTRGTYKIILDQNIAILKWWDEKEDDAMTRFGNERYVRKLLNNDPYIPKIHRTGYLVQGSLKPGPVIIMEYRKGKEFSHNMWYNHMDESERERFKRALRDAHYGFRKVCLVHDDPRKENIIWDRDTNTLSVIDWEASEIMQADEMPRPESFEIGVILTGCK